MSPPLPRPALALSFARSARTRASTAPSFFELASPGRLGGEGKKGTPGSPPPPTRPPLVPFPPGTPEKMSSRTALAPGNDRNSDTVSWGPAPWGTLLGSGHGTPHPAGPPAPPVLVPFPCSAAPTDVSHDFEASLFPPPRSPSPARPLGAPLSLDPSLVPLQSASARSLPSRKPPPLPAGAPPFPGCRVCPLLASPQPCWARPFPALHVPGSPKRSPCSPPPLPTSQPGPTRLGPAVLPASCLSGCWLPLPPLVSPQEPPPPGSQMPPGPCMAPSRCLGSPAWPCSARQPCPWTLGSSGLP